MKIMCGYTEDMLKISEVNLQLMCGHRSRDICVADEVGLEGG